MAKLKCFCFPNFVVVIYFSQLIQPDEFPSRGLLAWLQFSLSIASRASLSIACLAHFSELISSLMTLGDRACGSSRVLSYVNSFRIACSLSPSVVAARSFHWLRQLNRACTSHACGIETCHLAPNDAKLASRGLGDQVRSLFLWIRALSLATF